MSGLKKYEVSEIHWLTNDLVKLSFHDYDHSFQAGEHVTLSTLDGYEAREYSIYSGHDEVGISLLIKIVNGGYFTSKLIEIQKHDLMVISSPHGAFSFHENNAPNAKHWFISTGTGIAPMNSIILSHGISNYTVVHGVRHSDDAIVSQHLPADKSEVCVSREENKSKFKRVTDYLDAQKLNRDDYFYLCGNGNMVYDCKNLLRDKGVSPENIFTEVYF